MNSSLASADLEPLIFTLKGSSTPYLVVEPDPMPPMHLSSSHSKVTMKFVFSCLADRLVYRYDINRTPKDWGSLKHQVEVWKSKTHTKHDSHLANTAQTSLLYRVFVKEWSDSDALLVFSRLTEQLILFGVKQRAFILVGVTLWKVQGTAQGWVDFLTDLWVRFTSHKS